MLTKSQSKRMDDQRCSLRVMQTDINKDANIRKPLTQQNNIPPTTTPTAVAPQSKENKYTSLFNLI